MATMSNLVRNERVKLVANALDRASTASFAVGVLTPLALSATPRPAAALALSCSVWILVAVALHLVARWTLGRMSA